MLSIIMKVFNELGSFYTARQTKSDETEKKLYCT